MLSYTKLRCCLATSHLLWAGLFFSIWHWNSEHLQNYSSVSKLENISILWWLLKQRKKKKKSKLRALNGYLAIVSRGVLDSLNSQHNFTSVHLSKDTSTLQIVNWRMSKVLTCGRPSTFWHQHLWTGPKGQSLIRDNKKNTTCSFCQTNLLRRNTNERHVPLCCPLFIFFATCMLLACLVAAAGIHRNDVRARHSDRLFSFWHWLICRFTPMMCLQYLLVFQRALILGVPAAFVRARSEVVTPFSSMMMDFGEWKWLGSQTPLDVSGWFGWPCQHLPVAVIWRCRESCSRRDVPLRCERVLFTSGYILKVIYLQVTFPNYIKNLLQPAYLKGVMSKCDCKGTNSFQDSVK